MALEKDLKTAGKTVELYRYEGDDHNIFRDCSVAKPRSIASLDEYQKR